MFITSNLSYLEQVGTSKTDVVVSAIAQYLGCAENVPLSQRVAELERRMAAMESKVEAKWKIQPIGGIYVRLNSEL